MLADCSAAFLYAETHAHKPCCVLPNSHAACTPAYAHSHSHPTQHLHISPSHCISTVNQEGNGENPSLPAIHRHPGLYQESEPAMSKAVCSHTLHVQAHTQLCVGFSCSEGCLGERAENNTYPRQLTWGKKKRGRSKYWFCIWVSQLPELSSKRPCRSLPVLWQKL